MQTLKVTLGLPVKEDRFGKVAGVMRDVAYAIERMHQYSVDYYAAKGIELKLYNLMIESGNAVEARTRILDRMVGSHVFMLDADSYPEQDVLVKFLEADKDFIAAPMVQQGYPHLPNVFVKRKGEHYESWRLYRDFQPQDVLEGKIMECDAHGFGAVLIRREVFDEIRPPHFTQLSNPIFPCVIYGHDVSFSIRAKDAGLQLFTHFGAVVRHAYCSYLSMDAYMNVAIHDSDMAKVLPLADELFDMEVSVG